MGSFAPYWAENLPILPFFSIETPKNPPVYISPEGIPTTSSSLGIFTLYVNMDGAQISRYTHICELPKRHVDDVNRQPRDVCCDQAEMRKVLQTKTMAGGWARTQCGMIEIWWVREGSPPGGVEGYGPEGE